MIDYGRVITIESYYAGKLIDDTKKTQYEQSIFSTKETLLKDIIESMNVITNGTTKNLVLEVKVQDERIRIIKTWQA